MTDFHHSTQPRPEHVMLDLGVDVGALVVYTDADLHGAEVEISLAEEDHARAHKQVHERPLPGRPLYAAVFDRLPAGEYTLWLEGLPRDRRIPVAGAVVTELDWRRSPVTRPVRTTRRER